MSINSGRFRLINRRVLLQLLILRKYFVVKKNIFRYVVFHDYFGSNQEFYFTRDHKIAVMYRYVCVLCCTEGLEEKLNV